MRRHCGGLTLAEIIVSLALLGVVLVSLTGILTGTFAIQEGSEEDIAAANLARSVMDQWKSRPYAEVEALVGVAETPQSQQVDGRDYIHSIRVERLTPSNLNPGGRVLVMIVTLYWKENTTLSSSGTRTEKDASLVLSSVISSGSAL